MNTLQNALSLLPLLAAGLSAQSLELASVRHPAWIEARVDRADPGALVVLVLGTSETSARLPGGAVLGVNPDIITGLTIASADGTALLGVRLPPDAPDFAILAQGIAVHPRLALDAPGAIRVSNVTRMSVGDASGPDTGGTDQS